MLNQARVQEKPVAKPNVDFSISADALQQLRDVEGKTSISALERLIGEAKQAGDAGGASSPPGGTDSSLRREVLRVAAEMLPPGSVSSATVEVIKKQILGPRSFWVTEANFLEEPQTGVRFNQ